MQAPCGRCCRQCAALSLPCSPCFVLLHTEEPSPAFATQCCCELTDAPAPFIPCSSTLLAEGAATALALCSCGSSTAHVSCSAGRQMPSAAASPAGRYLSRCKSTSLRTQEGNCALHGVSHDCGACMAARWLVPYRGIRLLDQDGELPSGRVHRPRAGPLHIQRLQQHRRRTPGQCCSCCCRRCCRICLRPTIPMPVEQRQQVCQDSARGMTLQGCFMHGAPCMSKKEAGHAAWQTQQYSNKRATITMTTAEAQKRVQRMWLTA